MGKLLCDGPWEVLSGRNKDHGTFKSVSLKLSGREVSYG